VRIGDFSALVGTGHVMDAMIAEITGTRVIAVSLFTILFL